MKAQQYTVQLYRNVVIDQSEPSIQMCRAKNKDYHTTGHAVKAKMQLLYNHHAILQYSLGTFTSHSSPPSHSLYVYHVTFLFLSNLILKLDLFLFLYYSALIAKLLSCPVFLIHILFYCWPCVSVHMTNKLKLELAIRN